VAELDAYREQQAARFNYDIVLLLKDTQSREAIPISTQIVNCTNTEYQPPIPASDDSYSYEDPIIAELDAYRETQSARFDCNLDRIIEDSQSREPQDLPWQKSL